MKVHPDGKLTDWDFLQHRADRFQGKRQLSLAAGCGRQTMRFTSAEAAGNFPAHGREAVAASVTGNTV
jgi:hypothetical protein